MQGYIAATDFNWYTYLSSQDELDEVNFWQPSSRNLLSKDRPGCPFFFISLPWPSAIGLIIGDRRQPKKR